MAGLLGNSHPVPIGAFLYDKRLKCGSVIPCHVTVFPLRVEREVRPSEQGCRTASWFAATEAAALVRNQTLARIIRRLAQTLAGR